ncbi:MAG TPA: LamG domain-containing protein [Candidatus Krumholzibacteria bacterium]
MHRFQLLLPAAIMCLVALACSEDSSQPASPPITLTQIPPGVDDALLFLRFDRNLVDESSYERDVEFVGTPGYEEGCNDGAIKCGGDDYVYVPPDPSLEPETVTVEAWISPKHDLTNQSGFNPLVVKYSGNFWNTVDGYDLWYQDSGAGGRVGFGIGTNGGTVRLHASLTTPLYASKLYYIVGTFDKYYARLYINGDQVAATPYTGFLSYRGGGVRIGGGVYHSYYGGWQYYTGLIDAVTIYPRAMTDEEIRERYHSCQERYLVRYGHGDGTKGDVREPGE